MAPSKVLEEQLMDHEIETEIQRRKDVGAKFFFWSWGPWPSHCGTIFGSLITTLISKWFTIKKCISVKGTFIKILRSWGVGVWRGSHFATVTVGEQTILWIHTNEYIPITFCCIISCLSTTALDVKIAMSSFNTANFKMTN